MKMKMMMAMAVVGAQAYITNRCRQFTDDQLVEDFNLDEFTGTWYPICQSETMDVDGKCPVVYFDRLQPAHAT